MAELLNGGYDASQYTPNQGGSSLPIGRHLVVIESSEVKPNAANTGGYLQLNLKALDPATGNPNGNSGPLRLNLYAASEKAAKIAHDQMCALCHCVGVHQVKDTNVLHNIPFMVDVQAQMENGVATQYTEVKKILDRNGVEPGKSAPSAQPAAQGPGPGAFGQQPPQQQQQPQQQFNQQQPQQQFNQQQPQGGFNQQQPQQQFGQQPDPQQGQFNQQQPQGGFQQQPDPQQQQQPQGGFNQQQPQQQQQGGNFQPPAGGFNQQQPQQQAGGGAAPWGQPR